jgi:putative tryptophan/tyrosine transport system substrate-binding protein
LLFGGTASVQRPSGGSRIGFQFGSSAAATDDLREAFQRGLAEYGYVEGRNLTIEWRFGEGEVDRLPALAAELVALPVDAIVVPPTGDGRVVKAASSTIPIVVAGVAGDLVQDGLAASYARPGGNVTGLSIPPELVGKGIQLLTEAAPGITRVAILRQSGRDSQVFSGDAFESSAQRLGIQIRVLNLGRLEELEDAFAAARADHADGLYVSNTPVLSSQRERVVAFAAEHRLPAIYGRRVFVDDGGLMCYWPKVTDLVRRAAYFVDRILKGAKPADLPIEQPMTFDFVVNMRTARELGITFPPEIMLQVTEAIQ